MAAGLPMFHQTRSDTITKSAVCIQFMKRILKLREKRLTIVVILLFMCVSFFGVVLLPDFRELSGIHDSGTPIKNPRNDEFPNKNQIDALDTKSSKVIFILPVPGPASKSDKVFVKMTPNPNNTDRESLIQERQKHVVQMMKHSWVMYQTYAWGQNELRPISRIGHSANIFGQSAMGATIVDALDTLHMMGLQEEFNKARDWVANQFHFEASSDVSVFEINIRFVGGLLAAYALTNDEIFKTKAVEVVDKLLPAFDTETGIPMAILNLQTGRKKNWAWASSGCSILSEFGTLHLEFAYLTEITGNPVYLEKVNKIRKFISEQHRPDGVYPNYLHPSTGKWGQKHTSVGALGDSFYEYLLKSWLQNRTDVLAKNMYDEAIATIESKLMQRSRNGLLYIAEMKNNRVEHKMDHLACFAGGMIALGAKYSDDERKFMKYAEEIGNTCHESYDRTDTKLGPESFRFEGGIEAMTSRPGEMYYILRPEVIETYFYLWRFTGDHKYQDWAWEAVEALDKFCRTDGGYSGLRNVYSKDSPKDDVQQSFFLAETLKYLYLIFSPDSALDLDQWVLNTEAHPLPVLVGPRGGGAIGSTSASKAT